MTTYSNDINVTAERLDWQGVKELGKTVPFSMLTDEEKRLRMLGMPTSGPAQVITDVYYPTAADLLRMKNRGVIEQVEKIVKISDGNGGTIKAAVNGNGDIVDAEKETNPIVPLAIAAGLFFLLGG